MLAGWYIIWPLHHWRMMPILPRRKLLRSETNVKLAIGTNGIRSRKFLSFECPIGSMGLVYLPTFTIKKSTKFRKYTVRPIGSYGYHGSVRNRQMTRFAYGILLATMVQFLALGWYGLVTCSSYDGVKAETFRDCGVDSQAVLFFCF